MGHMDVWCNKCSAGWTVDGCPVCGEKGQNVQFELELRSPWHAPDDFPTDGTLALIVFHNDTVYLARWKESSKAWIMRAPYRITISDFEIKCWMPIPDIPKKVSWQHEEAREF